MVHGLRGTTIYFYIKVPGTTKYERGDKEKPQSSGRPPFIGPATAQFTNTALQKQGQRRGKTGSHHVESPLRKVVVRPRQDLLEALDGVLEGNEDALGAREHLGHGKGLGHETLYLTGPRHGELVVLRELVHSQDGDDVLHRRWRKKKKKATRKT